MPNYGAFVVQPLPGLNVQVTGGQIFNAGTLKSFGPSSVALSASAMNYVYFDYQASSIGASTVGFTQNQMPLAIVTTNAGQVSGITDARPDLVGVCGRLLADGAATQAAANITLGSGWGASAAVGSVQGNDNAMTIYITPVGTPAANANLTVTFNIPFVQVPIPVACDATSATPTAAALPWRATANTASAILTIGGTPSTSSKYAVNLLLVG